MSVAGRDVAAQDVRVLYHEALPDLAIVESGSVDSRRTPLGYAAPRLTFMAFGRQFDVDLERHDGFLRHLRSVGRALDITVYRGTLVGAPGSWVRLTRRGSSFMGALWDGSTLYSVAAREQVAPYLVSPDDGPPDEHVIYRLRDVLSAFSDHVRLPDAATTDEALLTHVAASLNATSVAGQLDIGLVVDNEFSRYAGAEADRLLISDMNVVEGIFLWQVGVYLNLTGIDSYAAAPDPFSDTLDPVELLNELENYKGSVPERRSLGLVHLVTGRNLRDDDASRQTAGIANFGVICAERLGVALTQGTFPDRALIIAHEIGHNFGAPHDGVAGACAATPQQFIMAPSLNGSTEFSACSVEQMRAEIEAATCLSPPGAVDVELEGEAWPASVREQDFFVVRATVRNPPGSPDVLALELSAAPPLQLQGVSDSTGPATWACNFMYGGERKCTLARLAAGASMEVQVGLIAEQPGTFDARLLLHVPGDPNLANNVITRTITVEPKVRLAIHQSFENRVYAFDEEIPIRTTVEVLTGVAINARFVVSVDELLRFTAVSSGTCSYDGSFREATCELGTLAAGETRTYDVTLRPRVPDADGYGGYPRTGSYWGRISAGGLDYDESYGVGIPIVAAIADLDVSISGILGVPIDTVARHTVVAENRGPHAATNVVVTFVGGEPSQGYSIAGLSIDVGQCDRPRDNEISCVIDRLEPGQNVTLAVDSTGSRSASHQLWVGARAADYFDPRTAEAQSYLTIFPAERPPLTPPQPSASGGGGGSTDAVLLLVLGWLVAGRRRALAAA